MKLSKNSMIVMAFLTGASLSFFIAGSSMDKSTVVTSSKPVSSLTISSDGLKDNDDYQVNNNVSSDTMGVYEKTMEDQEATDADRFAREYIDELKANFVELKDYVSDKWNSEGVQRNVKIIKEKLSLLKDFVFNGVSINGYTFADLSDNGKEFVSSSLSDFDSWLDKNIPDYKQRFYDFLVESGSDALELFDLAKDKVNQYKKDVLEEYNSRKK